MKKITCGIIGCGQIGPVHAACYSNVPEVQIKWLCDILPERAERMAKEYSVPHVTVDYRDIMRDKEVDCVSICTDHGSHAEIVCAALRNNKHVLCEKALASNRAGLDAMMKAHARKKTLVFSGVLQHRFDVCVQFAKEQMKNKLLGRNLFCSLRMNCYRSNDYYKADQWHGTWAGEGGSILINQAIHFIDVAAWIMGGVAHVAGFHANRTHRGVIETEDTAVASLKFKDGSLGSIAVTSSDEINDWDHSILFYGTNGMFEIRNDKIAHIELSDKNKASRLMADVNKREGSRCLIDVGKPHYGMTHVAQITDFVDAVRKRRRPAVTALDARHCVDIVLAVYESQKKGAVVALPLTGRKVRR